MSLRCRLLLLTVLIQFTAHALFARTQIVVVVEESDHPEVTQAAALLANVLPRVLADETEVVIASQDTAPAEADFRIILGAAAKPWTPDSSKDQGFGPCRGYWIQALPAGWAAAGESPLGTFFAVSHHLQQSYGVRWYTPGRHGAEYPPGQTLQQPRGLRLFQPGFQGAFTWPFQRDWALRNFQQRHYHYNHYIDRIITVDAQREHPQFRSTVNGRAVYSRGARDANPHYLAEGIADFVADFVREHFDANPEEYSLSLSTTDSVLFDDSPTTQSRVTPFRYFRGRPDYTPAVFHFTNEVAQRLYPWEANAEPVLGMLAYFWTERAPDFAVHPNVMPWLTADRHQWFDPAFRKDDQRNVHRWLLSGARLVGTWDYHEGPPYVIPRYAPHLLGESIQFLHRAGVDAYFAEGANRPGFEGPEHWVCAQLLWQPDQSIEALLEDYFQGYYRESAEPMRRYFDQCEAVWLEQPRPAAWLKYYESINQLALFPPDLCEALRGHLAQAEAQSRSPRVYARVRQTSRLHHLMTAHSRLYAHWADLAAKTEASTVELVTYRKLLEAADEAWADYSQETSTLLTRFRRTNLAYRSLNFTDWDLVDHLSFDQPFLPGDCQGFRAPQTPGLTYQRSLDGDWEATARHTEHLLWHRSTEAAMRGDAGIRWEGQEHAIFRRYLKVAAGQTWAMRLHARGQLSGDGIVGLRLTWYDRHGKRLSPSSMDSLPIGIHDWRPLTVAGVAPRGAVRARLLVEVKNQYPGDWVEVDELSCYTRTEGSDSTD